MFLSLALVTGPCWSKTGLAVPATLAKEEPSIKNGVMGSANSFERC